MKKAAKFLVKIVDYMVNFIALLLILMIMFLSCYMLWDSNQVYQAADAKNYEAYIPTEKHTKSFEELQKINPDIIGWIRINETNVNYPLLQAEDDDTYMNTDAEGKYSLSGSIFLHCANKPDFSDFNNMIYGHHMDHGGMFGDVVEYTDISYFEKHMEGWLYLADATYQIQMFACVETDAYDSMIYGCGADTDLNKLLSYIEEHAVVYKNMTTDRPAQVIGLSTCADARTNGRVIVFGRLEKIS